jgi:hypothetical protein
MTERPILPGVGGKLPGDLAERAADGLSRLGGVGIQVDIRIPLSASAIDGLYRTLPGGRDSLTAGPQHGRGGGAHAGRKRSLHLGGGRQAESAEFCAGANAIPHARPPMHAMVSSG